MPTRWRPKSRWSGSICSRPSGGIVLPVSFWRRFAAIENVVAVKIAPFNRYRTLDVVRGVAQAGAADRVTLYTGNDDHIVLDLLHPVSRRSAAAAMHTLRIKGGLLGHWSVWVKKAVELLDRIHTAVAAGDIPADLLALDAQVTDCQRRHLRRRQQFSRRHRRLP